MAVYLTRDQVRDVDRRAIEQYGMCGLVLMENAGRGAAELLIRLGIAGPVVIFCGRGNNGGDGFVVARHLDLRGFNVRVVVTAEPNALAGDARANYEILRRAEFPVIHWPEWPGSAAVASVVHGADWIVDGLLGTGSRGEPRDPIASCIRALNDVSARKFALDLPSGLDCDTGLPSGATFRADHTATFVAPKVGFAQPTATPWLGLCHVIEIGVPRRLLAEFGLSYAAPRS